MTIVTFLTPAARQRLARCLLIGRYEGHDLPSGVTSGASEDAAYETLKLAKLVGVFDEYWKLMQETPVLSVTVRNLDAPKQRGPRRKAGR